MSELVPPADAGGAGAVRPARLLLTQDLRVMPGEPPLRLINPLPPALAAPALAQAATVIEAALSARREAPLTAGQAERPEWQDWAAEDEPEGNRPDGAAPAGALSATGSGTEGSALPPQDGLGSAFFAPPITDPWPGPAPGHEADAAPYTPGPVPAFPGTLGDPSPDIAEKPAMLSVGDAVEVPADPAPEQTDRDDGREAFPIPVHAWQEPDETPDSGPERDYLAEEVPADVLPVRDVTEDDAAAYPASAPLVTPEEALWPTGGSRDQIGMVADRSAAMPEDGSATAGTGAEPSGAALALGVVPSIPAAGESTALADGLVDGLAPQSLDVAGVERAVLRRIVQDALREELEGALGERITRNVRKLVRAEIARALAARDLS
jgi:hypothetical protein